MPRRRPRRRRRGSSRGPGTRRGRPGARSSPRWRTGAIWPWPGIRVTWISKSGAAGLPAWLGGEVPIARLWGNRGLRLVLFGDGPDGARDYWLEIKVDRATKPRPPPRGLDVLNATARPRSRSLCVDARCAARTFTQTAGRGGPRRLCCVSVRGSRRPGRAERRRAPRLRAEFIPPHASRRRSGRAATLFGAATFLGSGAGRRSWRWRDSASWFSPRRHRRGV